MTFVHAAEWKVTSEIWDYCFFSVIYLDTLGVREDSRRVYAFLFHSLFFPDRTWQDLASFFLQL